MFKFWQDVGEILAGKWQDFVRLPAGSLQDSSSILTGFYQGFGRILLTSLQDLTNIDEF